MDKVEMPLTENSIIEICAVKNNWINYMDCLDLLYQLSEAKLIYKTQCKEGLRIFHKLFNPNDPVLKNFETSLHKRMDALEK